MSILILSAKISLVKGILAYFSEVRSEISKVTWPDKSEVIRLTAIVLLVSAIVGVYVGGIDFLFTKALSFFVSY